MPHDWRKQLASDVDFARSIILSLGEVQPMFVLHSPKQSHMVAAQWSSREEKRLTRALVRLLGVAEGVEAISFMSECWSAEYRQLPGESQAATRRRAEAGPPVSEREGRIEILMVMNVYRENDKRHCRGVVMEIIRDADGKVSDLVERTDPGGDEGFEGPLANLLVDPEPTPEERQQAQAMLSSMNVLHKRSTLH